MSQNNPENINDAGLESTRQFAARQLELANQQGAQGAEIAAQGREIDGLKQQVRDLQEMIATLTKPARPWFWRFIF